MQSEARKSSRKQRGATQDQLDYRRRMLLDASHCGTCGRLVGEHTGMELLFCHRRKARAVAQDGCPQIGTFGVHSESFYEGKACTWCGARLVDLSILPLAALLLIASVARG